jgi:hypothetical protein
MLMHNLWMSLGSNRCEAAPSMHVYGVPNRFHVVGAFGGHALLSCSVCYFDPDAKHRNMKMHN